MYNLNLTTSEMKALKYALQQQVKVATQRCDSAQEDNTKMLYEMLIAGLDNIQVKIEIALTKEV